MSELLSSMGYFSGINELVDPLLLDYETKEIEGLGHKAIYPLSVGENIYIDNFYHINSRVGETLLLAEVASSLWSNSNGSIALGVFGTGLYQLHTDYTKTLLLSNISINNPMSYWEWNDRIYFSNGVDIGYLKSGTVYSLTVPTVINPDKLTGGITSSSPMPYKVVMPPGQRIAVYRGHLLSAVDNVLYVSDAFSDCYDVRGSILGTGRAYIPFDSTLTMVRPVDDGIYIADGNTWFLHGKEFEAMEKKPVESSHIIPFTDANIDGILIGKPGTTGRWALWVSGNGIMAGDNDGNVINLTDQVINIPTGSIGAALVRNVNGLVQYIVTIKT